MLTSPCIDIYSIKTENDANSLYLTIDILPDKQDETIKTKTLLDCGAGEIFMGQNFAWKHNIKARKLKQPIRA